MSNSCTNQLTYRQRGGSYNRRKNRQSQHTHYSPLKPRPLCYGLIYKFFQLCLQLCKQPEAVMAQGRGEKEGGGDHLITTFNLHKNCLADFFVTTQTFF
jgi:hypothetical protein